MKLILLAIALLSTGCAIIPTQHGRVVLGGDYENVTLDDGSVHFHADKANHSNVVRAHWHGANNLATEAVTGAIGLHGSSQAIGALGAIIPPVVNRPTTRPTATPRP